MQQVKDLMTNEIATISQNSTLYEGRVLMGQKNIRHIPVVDDNNRYVGLLTQRVVLQEDIKIIDKYGFEKLETIEKRIPIIDVVIETESIREDAPLLEAGQHLLKDKHGALVVTEGGEIRGILTSVDFVRLSLTLLEEKTEATDAAS